MVEQLTRPAGMRMPKASELSPDFPPESVRGWCHIGQIRAWLPQSRNPNATVARVESWTLLSSKPEGVAHRCCAAHTSLRGWDVDLYFQDPRSLPMDATHVNAHGQIAHWGEFHPFFPRFLANLFFCFIFIMFVIGDCTISRSCISPASWERSGLPNQTFPVVTHDGAFQVWPRSERRAPGFLLEMTKPLQT